MTTSTATQRIQYRHLEFSRKPLHLILFDNLEVLIWVSALVFLAIHNPYAQTDFTFCPFKNLGFDYCPGCGLGRSVSFLLHGDIVRSIQTHILGLPALVILIHRITTLVRAGYRNFIFTNQ